MKVEIKEKNATTFGELKQGEPFTFQQGFGDHPYIKSTYKDVPIAVNLMSGSTYDVEHDTVVIPRKLKVVDDA